MDYQMLRHATRVPRMPRFFVSCCLPASVLLDASSKLRGRRQLALIWNYRVGIDYVKHAGSLR